MGLPKTRYSAFSYHLFLSLIFFLAIFSIMYFFWFPGALFYAAGGVEGIKIIAAVDMILGPVITLIVYNTKKTHRELIRDLSIILAIQLSCLSYGVYVIHKSRPVSAVLVFDTFYTQKKQDYIDQALPAEYIDQFHSFIGTKLFYVETAENKEDFLMKHVEALLGGTPLEKDTKLYKKMPTNIENLKTISIKHSDPDRDCYIFDIETVYKTGQICFSSKTQRFVYFKTENTLIEAKTTP